MASDAAKPMAMPMSTATYPVPAAGGGRWRGGAECHTEADFAMAQVGGVGKDAVESDAGQSKCEQPENA